MTYPPSYVFATSCFFRWKQKVHYLFIVVSITLVVIQIKVMVLILYDIPNDLQVPSNLTESFMH